MLWDGLWGKARLWGLDNQKMESAIEEGKGPRSVAIWNSEGDFYVAPTALKGSHGPPTQAFGLGWYITRFQRLTTLWRLEIREPRFAG